MIKIIRKRDKKRERAFIGWMFVIVILLVGSYAAFLGWKSKPLKHMPQAEPRVELVVDPVCGMEIKPPAAGYIEYRSKRYYFCGLACKEDFKKTPGEYIQREEAKKGKEGMQ